MQIFKLKWSLKDFDQDNTFTRHNKLFDDGKMHYMWFLDIFKCKVFPKKKIPTINTHETEKGQTWESYLRLFKLKHYILKKQGNLLASSRKQLF